MMKRALLIGAPLARHPEAALEGVANDIDTAREILRIYGFDCDEPLLGERASRDGIVARVEALIAEARADDAVVVYFSGHGGRVINTDIVKDLVADDYKPRTHQFLVAEDYQPSAEVFTGLLDIELRHLAARLAERTANVTVILDCCHSGGTMRGPGNATVKTLDEKHSESHTDGLNRAIHARLLRLRERLTAADAPSLTRDAHPHLVRIEAAHEYRKAYETMIDDRKQGVLTAAWSETLRSYRGQPVSWQALASEIQARARAFVNTQHVHVEGPIERRLFSLTREPARHSLACVPDGDDTLWLDGGRFQGVEPGARFAVLPPTSTELDIDRAVVEVRAVEVMPERTRVEVVAAAGEVPRWQGLHAWPLHVRGEWTGVAMHTRTAAVRAGLLRAIEARHRMHLCRSSDRPVATLVEMSSDIGTGIVVYDGRGACVSPPVTPERALALVERLQRAALVRMLDSGTGEHALPIPMTLRLEIVGGVGLTHCHRGDGTTEPAGEPMAARAGAQVRCTIENHASAVAKDSQDVYVTIFDINADGQVERLSKKQSSGIRVCGGEKYTLAYEAHAGVTPLALAWPAGMPAAGHGLRSLVVVAADRQHELRNLETWALDGYGATLQPGVLDVMSSQEEVTRGARVPVAGPLRYAVLRADVQVAPAPAGHEGAA